MFYSHAWFDSLAPLWLPLSSIGLYLGLVILLAEGLNRLTAIDAELTRKVVHIGAGHVILLAWWLKIPAWIGVGAATIASIVAITSYFLPILPSINSVGRKSWGTFFYAMSMGISIAWFWTLDRPQYAAIGILIMAWGDGMAAIVGQHFGKHTYQILGMTKSWEGSLAMAVVSFLVTDLILGGVRGNFWQIGGVSLVVAGVATALEAYSKLGIDNLTVPLGSAATAFFLSQFLG